MIRPKLEEIRDLDGTDRVIPLCGELFADIRTPIQILQRLKEQSKRSCLLESVEGGERWGRYSFLGFEPVQSVTCRDHAVRIDDFTTGKSREFAGVQDPVDFLRKMMERYRRPVILDMPPFTGGLVGYISYDLIHYIEASMKYAPEDRVGFNDYEMMLFDKLIVVDHLRQKILLIVNIETKELTENYRRGLEELHRMERIITGSGPDHVLPSKLHSEFRPLFTKEEYKDKVRKIKTHIREGDIFQAVLSNRLEADFQGDLLSAYRCLRTLNPSPYMFYLSTDNIQIAGASPETLIQLTGRDLLTFPIAGTCPRGETPEREAFLIRQLQNDEKELAEHTMLVDLGRNDLGKVCEFGSVRVTEHRKIVRYSHVCHMASTVTGTLRAESDAFDSILAVLPAGTLSGAPKRRACEIIDALEGHRRGVYGGAIGYIDFSGNMDFCIAIRMIIGKDHKIYIQSGAGIVADSDPDREYEECAHKAGAMISAIQQAGEVHEYGFTD